MAKKYVGITEGAEILSCPKCSGTVIKSEPAEVTEWSRSAKGEVSAKRIAIQNVCQACGHTWES